MADNDSLLQHLRDSGHDHIKVAVTDIDGVLRGKYLALDKFASALNSGFGFCDVVLGWDMHDQLYDNVEFTGWHSGYPDSQVRVLPETLRRLPFEAGCPFFLTEFTGAAEAICPRGVLRRVLQWAESLGFGVKAGFEYEFFVYEETPESAREKNYRNLKPLSPGAFGYSVLRNSEHADFYRALLENCSGSGIPLEGLHEETGAGVLEAALTASDGLTAADAAILFKTFAKVISRQHGKMATFMAKCTQEWPGQSGHIHISLLDSQGQPVFFDEGAAHGMSDVMQHFVAGQQQLMPQFTAMIAPTINDYSRLIPGFWAPTAASWGVDNRTCALRVLGEGPSSKRVEYRITSAATNPYLSLAAALASGLWGVENRARLGEPVRGNAYEVAFEQTLKLPETLWSAAQQLKTSQAARKCFGDAFVDHFAATREWEEREFRRHVTDWELRRYFEII